MKKFSILILVLFFALGSYAQELAQVSFLGGSTFSYFTFVIDQDLLIRISDDGKILEWGREEQSIRSDNYAPKLRPYLGRVEYFGMDADSAYKGKIKSIGTCNFSYYSSYETKINTGKLRSIGRHILDYYTNFENEAFRGKINLVGSLLLQYYPSYEDEGFRGKLKTVGSTAIRYHSSFDDKQIRGKVKSIGTINYDWRTSFDRFGSGLKSNVYRQNISGITYILQ